VCEVFNLTEHELTALIMRWQLPFWVDDLDSPPKFCPGEWRRFMERMFERIERDEPTDSISIADEQAAAAN
jgi:hypothetical protein